MSHVTLVDAALALPDAEKLVLAEKLLESLSPEMHGLMLNGYREFNAAVERSTTARQK